MKTLIVIKNEDFTDEKVKVAIQQLPCKEKLCRSLNHMVTFRATEKCDVIYTFPAYKDAVEDIYKGKEVKVKTFSVEEEKELAEMTKEDLMGKKKGELDDLCKQNEIFAEIKYSMLKKEPLVDAMIDALNTGE
jgi:hypothetical protein